MESQQLRASAVAANRDYLHRTDASTNRIPISLLAQITGECQDMPVDRLHCMNSVVGGMLLVPAGRHHE